MFSSPRFAIPHPRLILVEWTQKDLDDAHETLDLYDRLDALAAKRNAPKKGKGSPRA